METLRSLEADLEAINLKSWKFLLGLLVHVGVLFSLPCLSFQNFGADEFSGLEIQGASQREDNHGYNYTSYLEVSGV